MHRGRRRERSGAIRSRQLCDLIRERGRIALRDVCKEMNVTEGTLRGMLTNATSLEDSRIYEHLVGKRLFLCWLPRHNR